MSKDSSKQVAKAAEAEMRKKVLLEAGNLLAEGAGTIHPLFNFILIRKSFPWGNKSSRTTPAKTLIKR